MNRPVIIGLILSIANSVICYLSTDNYYVSGTIAILTILFFILVINRDFRRFLLKIDRFHECYHFINNFIVSLSIKGSIPASLEHALSGGSNSLEDEFELMSNMKEEEKVIYLNKYFPFFSYHLFSDIILLWSDEGGDILSMSSYLINELRKEEEYISFCEQENKKILIEFSILWIFSLAILFSLRFVLKDFYPIIIQQFFYPYAVGMVFVVLLISIWLIARQMFNIKLKGWDDEK